MTFGKENPAVIKLSKANFFVDNEYEISFTANVIIYAVQVLQEKFMSRFSFAYLGNDMNQTSLMPLVIPQFWAKRGEKISN